MLIRQDAQRRGAERRGARAVVGEGHDRVGALGAVPFGIDYFDYSNFPLGAKLTDKSMVEPFAKVYAVFAPLQRQWARCVRLKS